MPLTTRPTSSANKDKPLRAWEGVSAEEGVTTRRRSAKRKHASPVNQSTAQGASDEPYDTGDVITTQQNPSQDGESLGHREPAAETGKDHGNVNQIPEIWQNENLVPRKHGSSISLAATASVHTGSTSGEQFQPDRSIEQSHGIGYDVYGQGPISSHDTLQYTVGQQNYAEDAVFGNDPIQGVNAAAGEPNFDNQNKISLTQEAGLDYDSSMDDDIVSDVTVEYGPEALDQLRATNEDLTAENKYYRLLAQITMKTQAIRRGFMRSAIPPSELPYDVRAVHYRLMSDEGLGVPNTAADRAKLLSDVLQIHLVWEAENLKNCISAGTAVNRFVSFTGLFVSEIRGLAAGEFMGGEDTQQVRAEISVIVLKLVYWIVEQSVRLAEAVVRDFYTSSQRPVWQEESLEALSELDDCLVEAFRKRLLFFSTAATLAPTAACWTGGHVSGLLDSQNQDIIDWTMTQLTWAEDMSTRLDCRVYFESPTHLDMFQTTATPPPFSMTRHFLSDFLVQIG